MSRTVGILWNIRTPRVMYLRNSLRSIRTAVARHARQVRADNICAAAANSSQSVIKFHVDSV